MPIGGLIQLMPMAKKKRSKKKEEPKTEPLPEPAPEASQEEEILTLDIEEEAEESPKQEGSGLLKTAAIVVLAVVVLALVYYFLTLSSNSFVAGPGVTEEQFKEIFANATDVYIVMDVRGVQNEFTNHNILQCGVDFAGSSGLGGKTTTYFSMDEENCVAPDGMHEHSWCFEQLQNGLTIYVTEGEYTSLHTNGMIVGVGPEYSTGTCGIHRR